MKQGSFFDNAWEISPVSQSAAKEYAQKQDSLRAQVDAEMTANPKTEEYVGQASLGLMYANHDYHVKFMANVFKYNNYALLARISAWVYRSYSAQGFSYEYWQLALAAWKRSVNAQLEPVHAKEIDAVYQRMIDNHGLLIAAAESSDYESFPRLDLDDIKESFVELLIQGDTHSCMGLAMHFVQLPENIGDFYTQVLQPCLYEIGRRWERGSISVAHEHLAVGIVGRIMTACYLQQKIRKTNKGRIVITAAPNEFHEIGARMVADLLEIDGWDVDYVGANTPASELMRLLREKKPRVLGIAAVMPFNLKEVENIIQDVKNNPEMQDVKIMVGGLAYLKLPELATQMGADAYVDGLTDALTIANKWQEERA